MWLLEGVELLSIWQSGWAFRKAVVDTLVFLIRRGSPAISHSVEILLDERCYSRQLRTFSENELSKIDYRNSAEARGILEKVQANTIPLGEIAIVKAGVKLYEKGKGTPPQTASTMTERPYTRKGDAPKGWRPLLRGGDIGRYSLAPPSEYVKYGPWLAAPRTPELFDSPKIVMRRTDDRILAVLEQDSAVCVNSCHIIKWNSTQARSLDYRFLLGLLNSHLLQHVFELHNPQMVGKVFAEIKVIYVQRLPIRPIDFSDSEERSIHDRIAQSVTEIQELKRRRHAARTDHDRRLIQRQIDATDKQIDQLVYELYGLTDKEIRIVEEARGV